MIAARMCLAVDQLALLVRRGVGHVDGGGEGAREVRGRRLLVTMRMMGVVWVRVGSYFHHCILSAPSPLSLPLPESVVCD